jgi:hypothetical protein
MISTIAPYIILLLKPSSRREAVLKIEAQTPLSEVEAKEKVYFPDSALFKGPQTNQSFFCMEKVLILSL